MIIVIGFDADPEPQLDVLIELLQSRFGAVTVTRLEFTPPITIVPAWWESLANKTTLRVVRDTIVWYDTTTISPMQNRTKHSVIKAGDTSMQYWGKFKNGLLCVFSEGEVELWVSAGDVEPMM